MSRGIGRSAHWNVRYSARSGFQHCRLYAEWVAQLKAHHDEGAVDAAAAAASAGSTSYAAITSINSTTASHPDALPLRSGAQSAEGAPPMRAPPAATAQDEGAPIGEWPIRLLRATHGGRYVVATRPLRAGECVFCEAAPIAQTVTDSFSGLVCHCCYATLEEPLEEPTKGNDAASPSRLGCDECGGVWFCSLACKDALADVHRGECELVSQLRKAGVTAETSNLRLYLRLVQLAFEDGAACAQIEQMHEHYDDCDATRRQSLETQAEGLLDLLPPTMRMERTRVARLIDRVHERFRGGRSHRAGAWHWALREGWLLVQPQLRPDGGRELPRPHAASARAARPRRGRRGLGELCRALRWPCRAPGRPAREEGLCMRMPPLRDTTRHGRGTRGWQCTGRVGCQSGCVPPARRPVPLRHCAQAGASGARGGGGPRRQASTNGAPRYSEEGARNRSASWRASCCRASKPFCAAIARIGCARHTRSASAPLCSVRMPLPRQERHPTVWWMPSSAASMGWQRTSTRPSHTSSSFTSGSAQRSRGKPKWSSPQATSTRRPRRGSERARWALLRRRAWR